MKLTSLAATRLPRPPRQLPENFDRARHKPDTVRRFKPGNKITPLFDASVTPDNPGNEIFQQVKLALEAARSSIQLEMFGFGQMEIARALVALKDRVKIQVVLDPVNDDYEEEKARCAAYLEGNGIPVHWYPVRASGPTHPFPQLDHVKLLVVDGARAIVGGMNFGSHSPENHDVDVLAEGPIVQQLQGLFNHDFLLSGGADSEVIPALAVPEAGRCRARLLTENGLRSSLKRALAEVRPGDRLLVEQFCLTDDRLVDQIVAARARGADVRVLLHPFQIGGRHLNEKAAERLSRAGIPVRWFVPDPSTGSKLHAKLWVLGNDETILGSANGSRAGLDWNHEADLDVLDYDVNAAYTRMFDDDWARGSADPIYELFQSQLTH